MAGWYRRFISNFASVTAPIIDTLKKTKQFSCTDAAQSKGEQLKEHLTSDPLLIHPDFSKPFIVQYDASRLGVGAVLVQLDDEQQERPIAYFSQKLNSAQRNYSVTELECLAAVLSIQDFQPYIELMPFKVVTDHASLKWLMTQKDLSGRLARWNLKLQRYDFTIEHRKGNLNVVPDALSRIDLDAVYAMEEVGPGIDLDSLYFSSPEYDELRQKIERDKPKLPDVMLRDGYVYIRTQPRTGDPLQEEEAWKLWIPRDLSEELITRAHDPPYAAHAAGIEKTLERIRRHFFWP